MARNGSVSRDTLETKISVVLDIDGSGRSKLSAGLPFFEHMLDQIARHGLIDLEIEALGDIEVDAHHTVEDVGITLGQALAIANSRGYAVLIAHPHDITLKFLEKRLAGLEETTLVPLSSLTSNQSENLTTKAVGFNRPTQLSVYSQSPPIYRTLRQSDPFVDGVPSTRGSIVNAILSARPNALNIVSAW